MQYVSTRGSVGYDRVFMRPFVPVSKPRLVKAFHLEVWDRALKEHYRGIHADVIVYIFAPLLTTLRAEENLLGTYWLQTASET